MKRWFLCAALLFSLLGARSAETRSEPAQGGSAALISYQIRNVKTGELLRPRNASNADGTRIVLYPRQPWKCMTWKFHPAGESLFQIQNHFTSKTFAVGTNGGWNVVQRPFGSDPSKRPTWMITRFDDGKVRISDPASKRALTARQVESGGVNVVLENWEGLDEQKWELIETDPATLTM